MVQACWSLNPSCAERFATLDPDPPLSLLAAQEEVQEGVPLKRVHYELREVVSARPPTGMSGGGLSVVCESFRSPAGCCCRAVAEQCVGMRARVP